MMSTSVYSTFLQKSMELRQHLTIVMWQLLEEVFLYESQEDILTVSQILSWNHIASPATIHHRLHYLKQKNLIDLYADDGDGRIRYVVLSPEGRSIFIELSKAMKQAVSAHSNT